MPKKNIEVFEGHELKNTPPEFPKENSRCILLGNNANNQEVKLPLNDDLFSKHILFLGGIGTGKTNAIFQIIGQLRKNMTSNDVMLIFDTKGDYYNEFYQKGDIVLSNDEKATGVDEIDYWNIFKEIGLDESIDESIFEITRTLFYEKIQRTNQPFFPNAAKDIFSAILLHLYRLGDPSKANNAQIRSFLDKSPSSEIRSMLESHLDLKAMTSYISDDRSPQTQGIISELQQLTREILIGNFKKEGKLSIREAIRNKGGRVIFVEYDLGQGNVLTPIYRLLLDLAIKEALCRKKSEGNVWFIIDEFRLVPNLQHVDDGVNFGRSLGAKFMIGVQSVEQVFHAYGEALARSILSGFMTTVAFHVNDSATRSFVQQLFGKNRKLESYMATVSSRGLVEQVREANVVEDWDMNSLTTGKAVIGLPAQEPFLFHFKQYKKD